MATLSATDVYEIEECYAARSNEQLQRMCRFFTGKPPTNKQALSEFLRAQVTLPFVARTLVMVGDDGQALLAAAAHGSGMLRVALRRVPKLPLGSWEGRTFYSRGETPPHPVLLFFPDGLRMPPALRRQLAALLRPPPQPQLVVLPVEPPGQVLCADALSDITMMLHLAKAGSLEPTNQGLTSACLKRLVASSSAASSDRRGDHLRMQNLAFLLLRAKLLQYSHRTWMPAKTEIGHEDLKTLLRTYQEQDTDEIDDCPKIRGRRDHYAPWTEPQARRAELLRIVAGLAVGTWIDLRSLLNFAAATSPIEVLTTTTHLVGIGSQYATSMEALGAAGLDFLRDAWVRIVLYAHLQPLGIIDVAVGEPEPLAKTLREAFAQVPDLKPTLSPADTMTAVRLTPLGAWLLGAGPEPQSSVQGSAEAAWSFQADGTVTSLGAGVHVRDRLLLDTVAVRQDERSWRLERDSLLATLAQGTAREALQRHLAALSATALPQSVLRLLDDAQRRASAVSSQGLLVLLTVSDRHAAEQLVHDRHTAKLCRDFGDGRIGVAPADFSAFQRAARKLGWHIPAATAPGADQAAADGS